MHPGRDTRGTEGWPRIWLAYRELVNQMLRLGAVVGWGHADAPRRAVTAAFPPFVVTRRQLVLSGQKTRDERTKTDCEDAHARVFNGGVTCWRSGIAPGSATCRSGGKHWDCLSPFVLFQWPTQRRGVACTRVTEKIAIMYGWYSS
jgi:hypothetical protein